MLQRDKRLRVRVAHGLAHVDLIAHDRKSGQAVQHARSVCDRTVRLNRGLCCAEHSLDRKQADAAQTAAALGIFGVGHRPPHHLIAAADAENRRSCRVRLEQRRLHASLAQPAEIRDRGLGAGQDDEVRALQLRRTVRIADTNARNTRKCGKIGKIGQPRQLDHRNIHERKCAFRFQTLGKAVLIVDVEPSVRHNAYDRPAGQLLELCQTRPEDFHIAAEFVDDKAADARLLVLVQQLDRAVERGEHAAAVDVPDEQHRCVHELRKSHVHDVVLLEIDLGRAAGALDDNDVVLGGEAVGRSVFLCPQYSRAVRFPCASPMMITCEPTSLVGLSRIGFMRTSGAMPAASA